MIRLIRAALICTLAAGAACGRRAEPDPPAGSTSIVSERATVSPTIPSLVAACPATGRWAVCSIEKRLKRAGLVARKIPGEAPSRAGFGVKPLAYTIGRDSRLELFLYPDEASLAREIAQLDTIRVAPRGQAVTWTTPPTLIRSANLAAILLTHDPREADRLSLALTAGAPQPLH